jgi:hypothetical protein
MGQEQFKIKDSNWRLFAPARLQMLATPPPRIRKDVFGRVELCIGRLGAGKTTWASLRAARLARGTGHDRVILENGSSEWTPNGQHRQLITTGENWPEPWRSVASWEGMFSIENAVVVLDEVHLLAPSSRGLLDPETEKRFIRWLSLCRKNHVCTIGTTQAWTRVATHYRQLVGNVWLCDPVKPGVLHRATAHYPPDEGGREAWSAQWFDPASANISTNSAVWVPGTETNERAHGRRRETPPAPSAATLPPAPQL